MDEQLIEKLDTFFKHFKECRYKKGEILIRAGDHPSGIYYLKKGSVKEYIISAKGDELVVNVFKPISFFPMSWAISNIYNRYFFEAMTDVLVWKASKEKTLQFIKENPDVLLNLTDRLYKGMEGYMLRTTYLMDGSAYPRVVTELVIHTKRFGNKIEGKTSYSVKINERELATQAGMSRETVSRELKKLKNKGLVKLNKNVLTVVDLQKLEQELTAY